MTDRFSVFGLGLGTSVLLTLITAATWPLVTTTTGPEFAAALLWLVAQFLFAVCALVLSLIDWRTHLVPNSLSYSLAGALTGLCLCAAMLTARWGIFWSSCAGGLLLAGLYFVIACLRPGAMGLGDVKYAYSVGLITAWDGWGPYVLGAVGPFLLGGILVGVLLMVCRIHWHDSVPFIPVLSLGAVLALLVGDHLFSVVLSLAGLS